MATSQKALKKTYVKPVLKASASLRMAGDIGGCALVTSPIGLKGKCVGPD